MKDKKIVFPGDYLASCEELMPGRNTVIEKDDIYASAVGEMEIFGRFVQVTNHTKTFVPISEGMEVYCTVRELSETKAFLSCAPILKDNERSFPVFDAVLPVSSIRQGYIEHIRDELRIGDILKARVSKVDKQNIDVSIFEQGYGVIKAFCSRCRSLMAISGSKVICNICNRIENRKLPFGFNKPRESRRQVGGTGSYGSKYSKFR